MYNGILYVVLFAPKQLGLVLPKEYHMFNHPKSLCVILVAWHLLSAVYYSTAATQRPTTWSHHPKHPDTSMQRLTVWRGSMFVGTIAIGPKG